MGFYQNIRPPSIPLFSAHGLRQDGYRQKPRLEVVKCRVEGERACLLKIVFTALSLVRFLVNDLLKEWREADVVANDQRG
jgi:hypothetical protein